MKFRAILFGITTRRLKGKLINQGGSAEASRLHSEIDNYSEFMILVTRSLRNLLLGRFFLYLSQLEPVDLNFATRREAFPLRSPPETTKREEEKARVRFYKDTLSATVIRHGVEITAAEYFIFLCLLFW